MDGLFDFLGGVPWPLRRIIAMFQSGIQNVVGEPARFVGMGSRSGPLVPTVWVRHDLPSPILDGKLAIGHETENLAVIACITSPSGILIFSPVFFAKSLTLFQFLTTEFLIDCGFLIAA